MGLLFLDPLVQVAIVTTLVGCWLVWRGRLRFWFGRPGGWTAMVWPLPAVLVLTPLVVGPVRAAFDMGLAAMGQQLTDLGDALVFAGLYLVPIVGLTVWPPRWLLPPWARARLVTPTTPPAPGAAPDPAASPRPTSDGARAADAAATTSLPACLGRRGHGSRARWLWQVDAVAGVLTVVDRQVRFRPDPPPDTSLSADGVDPSATASPPGADPTLPPSGARASHDPAEEARSSSEAGSAADGARIRSSWGRRYLDADLDAVDQVRIHARRLWANDGVLSLELAGRPPAHLWVSDVARLEQALTATRS